MAPISIQWEGPFTLKEASQLTNEDTDYGIYQIYGRHPIYGREALLYIGKANQQTFAIRLKQHEEYWIDEYCEGSVKVYVGRLAGDKTPSDNCWNKEIDRAEQLLINVHKPAHNSQSIKPFDYKKDKSFFDVHILNWGEYGALLPEVSGDRWTEKWASDDYDVYGSH